MSVLIVGAGFAGLGMAIRLKQAGIDDFTILEQADDIGGTWRDNVYPGCACDVQSHLYSFSFEPNPDWSRTFASQPEILQYMRRCVDKYGLQPHLRLGAGVQRAEYSEQDGHWNVTTTDGALHRGRSLVWGTGALSKPLLPPFAGADEFGGLQLHSARWKQDCDLRGKRVAVIGTGASAIQIVPNIVDQVAQLDLYQRTAPWVVAKDLRPYSPLRRRLFRRFPALMKLTRLAIYVANEVRVLGMVWRPELMAFPQKQALGYLDEQVPDPELRRVLTPQFTMGCKRILLANDWYSSITQSHVNVITEPIERLTATGVRTRDGQQRPVDAVIYATGFSTQQFVPPGTVFGRDGRDLGRQWEARAQAYKGCTVHGFPNLFFIGGPNTSLGHSSIIYMHESQFNYIVDALRKLQGPWRSVEVTEQAEREYNDQLQAQTRRTVWASGCNSWYLNDEGINTTLWPGFTFSFRKQTRRFDPAAYQIDDAPPRHETRPDPNAPETRDAGAHGLAS